MQQIKFIIFDIKNFYSSISKKPLDDSINFARQHSNKKRRFQDYPTPKKITPLQQQNSMAKEKRQPSDLATEAYDGAEVCELVGLFPLNSLANEFDTNSVGLNRGDRLALFKNINGIGQKKYVKNSTNCLRKTDYL